MKIFYLLLSLSNMTFNIEDHQYVFEIKKALFPEEKKYNETFLKCQTVQTLKDICKSCGIGGYSGKNKAPLIKFMLEHKKLY
tara:strand:- start:452 stop:697 length:246 start_codon:yes stop_codon:yes gene_type:complete